MVHPKFSPPNAVPGSTLFTFDHRHRLLSRFFSLGFCKAQQPSATLHPAANHLYFPEHFFLPRCLFRLLASLHSLTYFFLYDRYSFDSLAHSSLTLHSTRRQHTLNGTVHTDFELCFTPRFAHSAAAVLMLLLYESDVVVVVLSPINENHSPQTHNCSYCSLGVVLLLSSLHCMPRCNHMERRRTTRTAVVRHCLFDTVLDRLNGFS